MSDRRDMERAFLLSRRYCECGCGRRCDRAVGPPGTKRLPVDRSKWRALASQCAESERAEAA